MNTDEHDLPVIQAERLLAKLIRKYEDNDESQIVWFNFRNWMRDAGVLESPKKLGDNP